MNRILVTNGNNCFVEKTFACQDLGNDDIKVKAVLTGICRSDIDMMVGKFGPLPESMSGHEGLGQVIELGKNVSDVNIGDFVATRGEPAYADQYIAKKYQYVKVPIADPKYILEPVACGINVVLQMLDTVSVKQTNPSILILGSGFLAYVASVTIKKFNINYSCLDVVGSHNKDLWDKNNIELLDKPKHNSYDIIVDLTSRNTVFDSHLLNDNGILVLATEKQPFVSTSFNNFLWKANTIICPSPRYSGFYHAMVYARQWVEDNSLDVANFWTRGYNRNTEWQMAFSHGLNRPKEYSRGYIYWT